jgi:hypothetical protein
VVWAICNINRVIERDCAHVSIGPLSVFSWKSDHTFGVHWTHSAYRHTMIGPHVFFHSSFALNRPPCLSVPCCFVLVRLLAALQFPILRDITVAVFARSIWPCFSPFCCCPWETTWAVLLLWSCYLLAAVASLYLGIRKC